MHWGAWTRQAEPRSSRPIGGGCCLADCHSLRRLHPISRLFPRPSTRRHSSRVHPYGAIKRNSPRRPQDNSPPASPQGEARRECAGKAERSECRAREDYGWGWAGGVIKPCHAPNPRRPPTTPAAAQAGHQRPRPNTGLSGSVSVSGSRSVSVTASAPLTGPVWPFAPRETVTVCWRLRSDVDAPTMKDRCAA